MKHVIYHTDYYDQAGNILREEEYDAYFRTLPEEGSTDIAKCPPVGCRLLQPKLVPSRLTKEQWEILKAKQPDYQVRYASLFDTDDGYAIYAIYERVFEDVDFQEEYMACVSFGENEELTLGMCVVPEDYDLGFEHVTRWDEVAPRDGDIVNTEKGIRIVSSSDPKMDKGVSIHYGGWTISGKWDTMEQIEPRIIVYHCHNSLFRFDITFNLERYPWDGDYESLLHE